MGANFKEEINFKHLAKEFAQAYLEILPACGELDEIHDQRWIELENKAYNLLKGEVDNK